MFDSTRLVRHRRSNLIQSAIILAGMMGLMAGLGWVVAGTVGVVWAVVGGLVALLLQPRLSWRLLRYLYGARPIRPAEAPGLYGIVRELARRAELSTVPVLFYIPSSIAQAVTVGRERESAIGLTEGMLRLLDRRELAGVLAHEISHIRHRDLWLLELASAASRLTSLFSTFGLVLVFLYLPLLLVGKMALPLPLLLLLVLAPTISTLLQLRLSRTREFDADAGAVDLTGDPRGLASALAKLERFQGGLWESFSRHRQAWLTRLLRTHPDTAERIARLESLGAAPEAPTWSPVDFVPGLAAPMTRPAMADWLRRHWY
jgi:heat shock protein HtpX